MVEPVRVDAVTDELVVSVETERLLAPNVETLMLLTDIALVHVSALLAPLVRTIPVGTTVKRPLMVILLHKNISGDTAFPHTPLHCRGHESAQTYRDLSIFMGTVVFHMIFMGVVCISLGSS
jgi:hypothetical protein